MMFGCYNSSRNFTSTMKFIYFSFQVGLLLNSLFMLFPYYRKVDVFSAFIDLVSNTVQQPFPFT